MKKQSAVASLGNLLFILIVAIALQAAATSAFAADQAQGPAFGPENAPVTAVLYYDFQCAFCGKTAPVLLEVVKEYGNLVRLVAINVPGPGHAYAMPAAELGLTAADQGKFWEAFSLLFENQDKLADADLIAYGKKLGLDEKLVAANLEKHAHIERIKKDFYGAIDMGLTATPTIFIGQKKLVGTQNANALRYYLNKELEGKGIASPVGPVPEPVAEAKPAGGEVPRNMIFAVKVQKPVDSKLAVKVGDKAPDFALPTVDGKEIRLADL